MKVLCQAFAAMKNEIKMKQLVAADPGHNKALIDKAIDSQAFWSLLNIKQHARKVTHNFFWLEHCSGSAGVELILSYKLIYGIMNASVFVCP